MWMLHLNFDTFYNSFKKLISCSGPILFFGTVQLFGNMFNLKFDLDWTKMTHALNKDEACMKHDLVTDIYETWMTQTIV